MTAYLSNDLAGTTTGLSTTAPVGYKPPATVYGARVKRFRAYVTYAAQAAADTIALANVPAGATFMYGVLNADTSSGSTTIAIGTSASAAKYKAATAFTATDTPTIFGKCAPAFAAPSSAEEAVIATLAAATAPSSGNLVIDLFFSMPS